MELVEENRTLSALPTRHVGVFTLRNFQKAVSRCSGYEFEDQIVDELEASAALIEPPSHLGWDTAQRAKRWLQRKGLPAGYFHGKGAAFPVDRQLDVLFFMPAVPYDLLALDAYRDWREKSDYAVCFIQEIWVNEIEGCLPDLKSILEKFDHVICGFYHSAKTLSQHLDTRVDYMPHSVDAELFNPFDGPSWPRDIDACAIGNMDPVTHDALWDWSLRTGRYYSFTSTGAADFAVSHVHHRQQFIQTLKRSKFFFTYLAKRRSADQDLPQKEFGSRYFEGMAAGAIQLGEYVPDNPGYSENLDWDCALFEVGYSSKETPDIIERLERDATWLEDCRRRNVIQCLDRHDHMYRWESILKAAGLEEGAGMAARRDRLEGLSTQIKRATVLERRAPNLGSA